MRAIKQSEICDSEMTSLKKKVESETENIPALILIAAPSGSGNSPVKDSLSIYQQFMDGKLTLDAGHFAGVEKPMDAEKRLLKVIRIALDDDDTSVQNEMALLRKEFNLEENDRTVWVYFRVLENLWAKLSEDIRSRFFLDGQSQVIEH
jgi:hypothetical protein